MIRKFSAIVEKEGKWYVALCPELDVASQGKTTKDTLRNLKESVELYLETASSEELRSVGKSHPLITTFEIAA